MAKQSGLFNRANLTAFVALGVLTLGGCGQSRTGVHGQVKLDGKPLTEAAIVFVPIENFCTKNGAAIVNGKYELDSRSGLLPGKYRVEILDNPPLNLPRPGDVAPTKGNTPPRRRTLPAKYSHNSVLRLEIAAASAGDSRELNYDLPSGGR